MKKFRCKVCGYIYEGDELPADFVCPLCHKGVEVFEEVQEAPAAGGDNRLKGTKTAENLATAFVNPRPATSTRTLLKSLVAKATNSSRKSSCRPLATNRNMPVCGLISWAASATRQPISRLQPKAKTTNGPICTPVSRRLPKKKASRKSLLSSVWSPPLKRPMKNAIASF